MVLCVLFKEKKLMLGVKWHNFFATVQNLYMTPKNAHLVPNGCICREWW